MYSLQLHYFADPNYVPDLLHDCSIRGVEERFGIDLTPALHFLWYEFCAPMANARLQAQNTGLEMAKLRH